MSIQEHLNKIRNAIYGREVRESIAKGIETAYDDASENGNANMEVKIARGTHPNLRSRLEEVDNKQQQTNAQLAQTVHVIDRYVSPKNFDTLDDCILFARENDKVIQADKIELSKETNFRHVGLEVTEIVLNGHTVELGGYNGSATKPPHQTIARIIGSGSNSERDKVFIRGMSYSTLKIGDYKGVINFRLRHDDGARYTAYSSFIFNNVTGIDIGDDIGHSTNEEHGTLWFNENTFHINNVHHLTMNGSYNHNLNRFYGGTFEGQDFNKIILNVGRQNYFYDIRAEGNLDIILSENTSHNHFNILRRYFPTIDDKGQLNRVDRASLSNLRTVQVDSASFKTYDSEHSNFDLNYQTVEGEQTGKLLFKYGRDFSYESDFYSLPQNKMAVFETDLINDKATVPIFYKIYDENYEEIQTSPQLFYVTTFSQDLQDDEEGLYLSPNETSFSNLDSDYDVPGLTNRIRVLYPFSVGWKNIASQAKYVRFYIGYSGAVFNSIRVSIIDLKGNYGVRYFGNV